MTETAEPLSPLLDEQFLQRVDESLGEMLGRVSDQEQQLGESDIADPDASRIWEEITGRLNDRLGSWQAKLEAVAEEVREVESELRQHQEALRGWTATLESVRNAALEGGAPAG